MSTVEGLLAQCPYKSKSHAGAFRSGVLAVKYGRPKTACPYDRYATAVVSKGRHVPTGARGFAKAWAAGWQLATDQGLTKD